MRVQKRVQNPTEVQNYLRSQFDLDKGRYAALPQTAKNADNQANKEANEVVQQLLAEYNVADPPPVKIEDVYCFECALLQMEPIGLLRRRAWIVRETYRALAGPSQYDLYLKSEPPDAQGRGPAAGGNQGAALTGDALTDNEAALRNDMHMLTGEVFRILSLMPQRERLRNATILRIGMGLVIFWIVVLALGIGTYNFTVLSFMQKMMGTPISPIASGDRLWVIFPVCVAGATGAFISVQRRMQNLPTGDTSAVGFYALYYGRKSLFWSPVAGVVFAGLLYLIFSAGLVQGNLFPRITNYVPPANSSLAMGADVQKPRTFPLHLPQNAQKPFATSAKPPAAGIQSAADLVKPPAAGSQNAATSMPATASDNKAHPTEGSDGQNTPPDVAVGSSVSASSTANPTSATGGASPPSNSQDKPNTDRVGFLAYAYHTRPEDGTEWAKLLVWSFLAGFAEQLVPDILNRITNRQAAIDNTKEVKTG